VALDSGPVLERLVRNAGLWKSELCFVFHPTITPPFLTESSWFGAIFVNESYAAFVAVCTPVYPIERAFG
jgi:hypothetical protein